MMLGPQHPQDTSSQGCLGTAGRAETLQYLLFGFFFSHIIWAVTKSKYNCHRTWTSLKHTDPGPKLSQKPSSGFAAHAAQAWGWDGRSIGILFGSGWKLLTPARWRLCLSEHRSPGQEGLSGDTSWLSSPSSLPLPSASSRTWDNAHATGTDTALPTAPSRLAAPPLALWGLQAGE